MSQRTAVHVHATDPLSQAGIAAQLRGRPELWVLDTAQLDQAEVAVLVADEVGDETLAEIGMLQRLGCTRVVLVVSRLDDAGLLAAIEAGVTGLVPRAQAQPESLSAAITAAADGNGSIPPDLLGRLLGQVSQLQRNVLAPRGLRFCGLTERETEVLRLLADGHDTEEVAQQLHYSGRTVKNVVQDITRRHNLRNRTHAVAYALRQGLI